MAVEIPSQIKFEHLLCHTYPGFFFAITVFMLIDILSPIDLTSWVMSDITGLAGFIAIIFLIGTVFGVLIDGIHHIIIETHIFQNFIGCRELIEFYYALVPRIDIKLRRSYFFKKDNSLEIDEYLMNDYYRYSEFCMNIFISLIFFSFIAPFYIFFVWYISWSYAMTLALISFLVACMSLIKGYDGYKTYLGFLISDLCGYLNYDSYIKIEKKTPMISPEGIKKTEIEATLYDKKSQRPILQDNLYVNFTTTLGKITQYEKITSGKAKAILTVSENHGNKKAIITATSERCIPGVNVVDFDEKEMS